MAVNETTDKKTPEKAARKRDARKRDARQRQNSAANNIVILEFRHLSAARPFMNLTTPVSSGSNECQRLDVPPEPVCTVTVAQYHAMIRAGTLAADRPIELLEGCFAEKAIKNPRHRVAMRKTRLALERIVPAGWSVDVQEAVTLNDNEPEPDIAVIRGDTSELLDRHAGPSEIALLIEVADTSLERDRTWKKRIYASAAVPVYWIVNLIDEQLEIYAGPSGPASGSSATTAQASPSFASCTILRAGENAPLILDGQHIGEIQVDDLLP